MVVDVEEVPQEEEKQLKVFPNPSTGWLNIRWKGDKGAQLGIYNLDGRLVWSGQSNEHNKSVDLSGQPTGMYFVRAKSEGKTVQQKVILSR